MSVMAYESKFNSCVSMLCNYRRQENQIFCEGLEHRSLSSSTLNNFIWENFQVMAECTKKEERVKQYLVLEKRRKEPKN